MVPPIPCMHRHFFYTPLFRIAQGCYKVLVSPYVDESFTMSSMGSHKAMVRSCCSLGIFMLQTPICLISSRFYLLFITLLQS